MITGRLSREIDRTIKRVWLEGVREDYARGRLLREASLQTSLYHHLRSHLEPLLEGNNLFIYPEFYLPELKYRADLAIVQMDLSAGGMLSSRVSGIAAIIELKFDVGTAQGTAGVIKADLQKLRQYAKQMDDHCQFYFGVIYETECAWLHWLDRRSTTHWADGRVTELNAGYLNGEMIFEINSYNHMGIQHKAAACPMLW